MLEHPKEMTENSALISEWLKELLLYKSGSINHDAIFGYIANLSDQVIKAAKIEGHEFQIYTETYQGDFLFRIRERNFNGSKWGLVFCAPLYKWADYLYKIPEDYKPDFITTEILETYRRKAQLLTDHSTYPQVTLINNRWE